MDRQPHLEAFKRILEIANRDYLYEPFKNNALRAKFFPGAGSKIGRKKLIEAYAKEFLNTQADEKLLQHGAAAWIHGYDTSLSQILEDLKQYLNDPPETLSAARLRDLEKRFTKQGADEIAAFWTIYAYGDTAFRQAVIDQLANVKPPEAPSGPPKLRERPQQIPQQTAADPNQPPAPAQQSVYALFGSLIFFVPALLWVGFQYWRLPGESHWIVVSIAAVFGLITLIFLIDFLRKRNSQSAQMP